MVAGTHSSLNKAGSTKMTQISRTEVTEVTVTVHLLSAFGICLLITCNVTINT